VISCSSQENCLQRGSLYSGSPTRTAIGFDPAVQWEMTESFDTQIYYYETDNFVYCNKSRLQEGTEVAKCKTEMLRELLLPLASSFIVSRLRVSYLNGVFPFLHSYFL